MLFQLLQSVEHVWPRSCVSVVFCVSAEQDELEIFSHTGSAGSCLLFFPLPCINWPKMLPSAVPWTTGLRPRVKTSGSGVNTASRSLVSAYLQHASLFTSSIVSSPIPTGNMWFTCRLDGGGHRTSPILWPVRQASVSDSGPDLWPFLLPKIHFWHF